MKKYKSLFQAYVDNFGDTAACEIMKVITDGLGGLRLLIPKIGPDGRIAPNAVCAELYSVLREKFGDSSGRAIMQLFFLELGGERMTFPSPNDIVRAYRNERMLILKERGYGYEQLGRIFCLSEAHVKLILRKGQRCKK